MAVDDGRWLAVKEERKRMEGNARPAGVDPLNAFPEVRSLHVVIVRIRSAQNIDPRPCLRPVCMPDCTFFRVNLGAAVTAIFPFSTLNAHLTLGESTIGHSPSPFQSSQFFLQR